MMIIYNIFIKYLAIILVLTSSGISYIYCIFIKNKYNSKNLSMEKDEAIKEKDQALQTKKNVINSEIYRQKMIDLPDKSLYHEAEEIGVLRVKSSNEK